MNAKLIEEEKAKEAAGESDLGRQPLEDVMKVGGWGRDVVRYSKYDMNEMQRCPRQVYVVVGVWSDFTREGNEACSSVPCHLEEQCRRDGTVYCALILIFAPLVALCNICACRRSMGTPSRPHSSPSSSSDVPEAH
jgi:phage terminase large subunit-like protein